MSTLDDWILHSTGSFIGEDTFDPSGSTEYQNYYNTGLTEFTDPYKLISSAEYGQMGDAGKYYTGYGRGTSSSFGTVYDQYQMQDSNAAREAVASRYGYAPQSADTYYTEQYGSEFTQEQIDTALSSRYGTGTVDEKSAWILSQTDNLLGGEVLDYTQNPDWSKVDKNAAWDELYKQRTGGLLYNPPEGTYQEMEDWQLQAHRDLLSEIGFVGIEGESMADKYARVATEENLMQLGYEPPTVDDTELMKYRYGEEFTEADIAAALDTRYGEVQGISDMGKGWNDLYDTYKTWEAEDASWYEYMKKYSGLEEGFESSLKAQMAAGGMQAGSDQWEKNIESINKKKFDLDKEYEEKQEALKGTSVYQALEDEYKRNYLSPELRSKTSPVTKYKDELIKEGYWSPEYTTSVMRYDSELGQSYTEEVTYPAKWHDPVYGKVPYESYETNTTETGKLQYGSGEDKIGAPTFDEYYTQNFGMKDYGANIDAWGEDASEQGVLTEEQKRARAAAGGRKF